MRSWIAFQSLAIGSAICAVLPEWGHAGRSMSQQPAMPDPHLAETPLLFCHDTAHSVFLSRLGPASEVKGSISCETFGQEQTEPQGSGLVPPIPWCGTIPIPGDLSSSSPALDGRH
jgi:hypothetical protein